MIVGVWDKLESWPVSGRKDVACGFFRAHLGFFVPISINSPDFGDAAILLMVNMGAYVAKDSMSV